MQTSDANRARFALYCRKVRLYIAAHPGVTEYEIKKALGGNLDMALGKMCNMEIIKCERHELPNGRNHFQWYVIPQ